MVFGHPGCEARRATPWSATRPCGGIDFQPGEPVRRLYRPEAGGVRRSVYAIAGGRPAASVSSSAAITWVLNHGAASCRNRHGQACELVRNACRRATEVPLDASMRLRTTPLALCRKTPSRRARRRFASRRAGRRSPPLYVCRHRVPVPAASRRPRAALRHRARTPGALWSTPPGLCRSRTGGRLGARDRAVVQPGGVRRLGVSVTTAKAAAQRNLPAHPAGLRTHSPTTRPRAPARVEEGSLRHLKVGPWLTFAFREAGFALAALEREWLEDHSAARGAGSRMLANLPTARRLIRASASCARPAFQFQTPQPLLLARPACAPNSTPVANLTRARRRSPADQDLPPNTRCV